MTEQRVLQEALDKLKELTGLQYNILKTEERVKDREIDAFISLGSKPIDSKFNVEIKHELRSSQLPRILNRLETVNDYLPLIISQYIPKPLKQELKALGVNYLEAAGNAYIKTKEIFVYINDQQVTATRLSNNGRLWTPAGLRFVFTVLQFPDIVNQPYRKIAQTSNIGLGTVGLLIAELESEGFLKNGTSGQLKDFRFIEQRERLIQKWAELYRAVLRPKLVKGTYRFMKQEDYKCWQDIVQKDFLWGAETAGALLTNYLSPEIFTIYTHLNPSKLMKELKLIPDKNGKIEVLEQFWEGVYEPNEIVRTVPFLLAYAELITSFDSRCQETAVRIKQRYLEK